MNISAVKLALWSRQRCAVFSELDDTVYARDYALKRSMKHMKLLEREMHTQDEAAHEKREERTKVSTLVTV